MQNISIAVKRLPSAKALPLPKYATKGSAGADIVAAVLEDMHIGVGERALIPTGLMFEIPCGYHMQVRPRSGLALKHGVTVLNAPGTIDADYRGELRILLINHGEVSFTVKRGMRIAQIVVASTTGVGLWHQVSHLGATNRDVGGFGSTGT